MVCCLMGQDPWRGIKPNVRYKGEELKDWIRSIELDKKDCGY